MVIEILDVKLMASPYLSLGYVEYRQFFTLLHISPPGFKILLDFLSFNNYYRN
jgi:hypothetical protein